MRTPKLLRDKRWQQTLYLAIVLTFVFSLVFLLEHDLTRENKLVVDENDPEANMGMSDPEANMDMTAAVASVMSSAQKSYAVASDTPQFVVLSFDGSKSLPMLEETLDFQKKMQAERKPLHFTYFINAAYFLTKETGKLYHPPGEKAGVSNIGFSDTAETIPERVALFNAAHAAGNEIASHSVGHFNGSHWTYGDWRQEFRQFNSILFHTVENNTSVKIAPWSIKPNDIVGFRAPNLGINAALYQALHDAHFTYDASGVARGGNWPEKDINGIWRIPLGMITIGAQQTPVIAIDYSIWKYQIAPKEVVKQGSEKWNSYFKDVTKAYMDYFDHNYNGSRAPVVIANHFTKWNDGVYWEAMKTFAEEVCGKVNVRCTTFSELVHYLEVTGAPREN